MSMELVQSIHVEGSKFNAPTLKYQTDIDEFLGLKLVTTLDRLKTLIKLGDRSAADEAEERLLCTVISLKSLVTHFQESNKKDNAPDSELLSRFSKGLDYALTGFLPG